MGVVVGRTSPRRRRGPGRTFRRGGAIVTAVLLAPLGFAGPAHAAALTSSQSDLSGGGYENTLVGAPSNAASPSVVLAGGDTSGVHRSSSTALATTWTAANNGLGGANVTNGQEGLINDTAVDTKIGSLTWSADSNANSSKVYGLTGTTFTDNSGAGHFVWSTDSGLDWNVLTAPSGGPQIFANAGGNINNGRQVGHLIAADDDPSIYYHWVFVASDKGIWQIDTSTNPFTSTHLSVYYTLGTTKYYFTSDEISSIALDAGDSYLIFVVRGASRSADDGVWATTNGTLGTTTSFKVTQLCGANTSPACPGAADVTVLPDIFSSDIFVTGGTKLTHCDNYTGTWSCPSLDSLTEPDSQCQYNTDTAYNVDEGSNAGTDNLYVGCTNYTASGGPAYPGADHYAVEEVTFSIETEGWVSTTFTHLGRTESTSLCIPGTTNGNVNVCSDGTQKWWLSKTSSNWITNNYTSCKGPDYPPCSPMGGDFYSASQLTLAEPNCNNGCEPEMLFSAGHSGIWASSDTSGNGNFTSWRPYVNGLNATEDHHISINPTQSTSASAFVSDTDWSMLYSTDRFGTSTQSGNQGSGFSADNQPTETEPIAPASGVTDASYTSAYDDKGDLFVGVGDRGSMTTKGDVKEWLAGSNPGNGYCAGPGSCPWESVGTPSGVLSGARPLGIAATTDSNGETRLIGAFANNSSTAPGVYYNDCKQSPTTWSCTGWQGGTGTNLDIGTSPYGTTVTSNPVPYQVSIAWLPAAPGNQNCHYSYSCAALLDPATGLWLTYDGGQTWQQPSSIQVNANSNPFTVTGSSLVSADPHSGSLAVAPDGVTAQGDVYITSPVRQGPTGGAAAQVYDLNATSVDDAYTTSGLNPIAATTLAHSSCLGVPGEVGVDPADGTVYVTQPASGLEEQGSSWINVWPPATSGCETANGATHPGLFSATSGAGSLAEVDTSQYQNQAMYPFNITVGSDHTVYVATDGGGVVVVYGN